MKHLKRPLNVSHDALDDVYGNGLKGLPSNCVEKGRALNAVAMKYINQDGTSGGSDFSIAFDYLKKAEKFLQNDAQGKLLTYQNLAFLYQKVGYPRLSLKYLKRAGVILNELEGNVHVDKRVDCHLNICATMSRLGNHKIALMHAKIAIAIIKDELNQDRQDTMKDNANVPPIEMSHRRSTKSEVNHPILENKMKGMCQLQIDMLAIAYYNAGVECEHLGNIDASVKFYQQGMKVSSKLKKDHIVRKSLECITSYDLHARGNAEE